MARPASIGRWRKTTQGISINKSQNIYFCDCVSMKIKSMVDSKNIQFSLYLETKMSPPIVPCVVFMMSLLDIYLKDSNAFNIYLLL